MAPILLVNRPILAHKEIPEFYGIYETGATQALLLLNRFEIWLNFWKDHVRKNGPTERHFGKKQKTKKYEFLKKTNFFLKKCFFAKFETKKL